MAATWRLYKASTSAGESSTTSTGDTDKVTLQFPVEAGHTYVIFGSCLVKESSTSYYVKSRLYSDEDGALTYNRYMPKDTTDYVPVTLMHSVNPTGAGTYTYRLQYGSSSASGTAYIKEARLIVLELFDIDDVVNANSSVYSTTSTSYQTAISSPFTPGTSGDFIVLAYSQLASSSTSGTVSAVLEYDSTEYQESIHYSTQAYFTNWGESVYLGIQYLSGVTTSEHSFSLKIKSNSASYTAYAINARTLVLAVNDLDGVAGDSDDVRVTSSDEAWHTFVSTTLTSTNRSNSLVVGRASIDHSAINSSTMDRLYVGSTTKAESLREMVNASARECWSRFDYLTETSNNTLSIDYNDEAGTSGINYGRLYVITPHIRPTPLSKTGAWSVRSNISTLTKSAAWGVSASGTYYIYRTAAWAVPATIDTLTRSAAWSVRTSPTPLSLSAAWSDKPTISTLQLTAAWAVKALINTYTRQGTWAVITSPTPLLLSAAWSDRSTISTLQSTAAWSDKPTISTLQLSATWSDKPYIDSYTRLGAWAVVGQTSFNRDGAWKVLTFHDTTTLSAAWMVLTSDDVQLTAAWSVLTSPTPLQLTAAWSDKPFIETLTRTAGWATWSTISSLQRTAAWGVESSGTYYIYRTAAWAVPSSDTVELGSAWKVITGQSFQLSGAWKVIGETSVVLGASWAVPTTLTPDLDADWKVLTSNEIYIPGGNIEWDVITSPTIVKNAAWSIPGEAAIELDADWMVKSSQSLNLTAAWKVGWEEMIWPPHCLLWSVRTQRSLALTASWTPGYGKYVQLTASWAIYKQNRHLPIYPTIKWAVQSNDTIELAAAHKVKSTSTVVRTAAWVVPYSTTPVSKTSGWAVYKAFTNMTKAAYWKVTSTSSSLTKTASWYIPTKLSFGSAWAVFVSGTPLQFNAAWSTDDEGEPPAVYLYIWQRTA